jgi:hypothetical protein
LTVETGVRGIVLVQLAVQGGNNYSSTQIIGRVLTTHRAKRRRVLADME